MQPIRLDTFLPYRLAVVADRLSRLLQPIYEAAHGLSTPQWRIMAAVAEKPGRTAQDVVRMTPMEKATVSRAVSALIARGLLKRETDDRDARAAQLELTPAGENLYRQIAPEALKLEALAVAGLPHAKSDLLALIAEIEARLVSVALEEVRG